MPTSLKKTLDDFGLEIPESSYAPMKHYCQKLWQLNTQLNLTRHTSYEKFVSRDLLDTLEISKLISEGKEVLDIGSGGGVPGIVLAILRPDLRVTLCESIGKKASALNELNDTVGLNLEIYNCRAEDLLDDFRYDFSTARAVGPLKKIGLWFDGKWDSLGNLLAVKGPNWVNERQEAEAAGLLQKVNLKVAAEYDVPDVDWKSVILQISAGR
ncbi:MAG: 16S rRNA (guanine(527)-N(7))-methyltransferase RsmG [Planctomycetota bacterium]